MKKRIERMGMITESRNAILKKYDGDIRLDCGLDGYYEYWIGEKGTTTLKALMWNDCKQSEGEGWLIDFGITAKELRADTHFVKTCLEDPDVNHGLEDLPTKEGCTDLFRLENRYAKRLFYWYLGFTSEMPVTPCGFSNYYDSYICYPE